ncbi:hypothetical protein FRC01_013284 [Tulasnella sp. 417]|nr:hypothetical protein FRC01_013284 [Tulasnella sp. 417]
MAIPTGTESAGSEALDQLLPKTNQGSVIVVEGLQARDIGGGFVAALPVDSSSPTANDGSDKKPRRFLQRDEVEVPDSLQSADSKRAGYCKYSGYGPKN